jgi:hypothetical protein
LTESVRLEWSGDVDLGDGSLQKQHNYYLLRIKTVKSMNQQLYDSIQRKNTIDDLQTIMSSLEKDLLFIPSGNVEL